MHVSRYSIGQVLLGALLAFTASCIDPYNPKVTDANVDYLVVDGFINSKGATTIKLSHTFNLSSKAQPPAEKQARMYIEDERGAQYALTESTTAAGTYTSAPRTLDPATKYRLHFFTKVGKEYASDYTEVKNTPPIDTLTWNTDSHGLTVNVSTHDDTNKSVYYRWNFEETWEYTSAFRSVYEYKGGQMIPRRDNIYDCWGSNSSNTIKLANTTRLTKDALINSPLLTIPPTSVKLRIKYSILVKQCAQTPEEYKYWEILQKNTESIGTLFDPLPSQLTGNVHCINEPDVPVLGYVGAYSVTEKRMFVSRNQLPREWRTFITGYENCINMDTVAIADIPARFQGELIPIEPVIINGVLIGYTGSGAPCVDCRMKGTNVRPLYWQ
jgi:hypothetical protein